MIELKNNSLCFSFPQIEEVLRKLAQEYTLEMLPRILGEDHNAALDDAWEEVVRQNGYEACPALEDYRKDMHRFVHQLSERQITDAFRKKVEAQMNRNRDGQRWGHMTIEFQRTLRIPDDGNNYSLPPGLGQFPLRHVDDYSDRVPTSWLDRGGVLMPMYQAEALWLHFNCGYPFAVKIASGKINAITGETWRAGLNREPQDYLVLPDQPWLDGFAVEKGIIRQFVAMPLGAGYSVEEQLTGKADFGGIQIQAYPMRAEVYFCEEVRPGLAKRLADLLPDLLPQPKSSVKQRQEGIPCRTCIHIPGGMGLGQGGRMRQEIYEDPNDLNVWDQHETSRCFVHLCNALVWREITGTNPPQPPITAKEYERAGLPWFDFYRADVAVLNGSKKLAGVKSIAALLKGVITGNDSVKTGPPVNCGPQKRPAQVREWEG